MKKKSPAVAALFGAIAGPIGYFYIGWHYAVLAHIVCFGLALLMTLAGLPTPFISKLAFPLVWAIKAHRIASVRNTMIESHDERASLITTWPIAWMAISDLTVGMAAFYAGSLGIHAAIFRFTEGRLLRGLLILAVGTPMVFWVTTLVAAWFMTGIDILFLRRKAAENFFRCPPESPS